MLGHAKAASLVGGASKYLALITALAIICSLWMVSPALAQQAQPNFSPSDAWALIGTEYGDGFSSVFLNQIFGPLFPAATGANVDTVFSRLIGYFNIIILVIGGMMFFWNITIGIMQSAHEGSVLGQRWSSLWAPLRVVAAIGMLVPVPGLHGYNLAQAGVAYNVKAATNIASFFWGKSAELVISDNIQISAAAPSIPPSTVETIWSNAACTVLTNAQMDAAKAAGGAPMTVMTDVKSENQLRGSILTDASRWANIDSVRALHQERGTRSYTTYLAGGVSGEPEELGICGTYKTPVVPEFILKTNPSANGVESFGVSNDGSQQLRDSFIEAHARSYTELSAAFVQIISNSLPSVSDLQAPLPNLEQQIITAIFDTNNRLAADINQIMIDARNIEGVGDTARDRMIKRITGDCSASADASKIGPAEECYGEGWIGAGSWYMMLARMNNELSTLTSAKGFVTGPASYNPSAIYSQSGAKQGWMDWAFGNDDPAVSAGMLSTDQYANITGRYIEVFAESTIRLAALGFTMSDKHLDELNSTTDADSIFALIPSVGAGFNSMINKVIEWTSPSNWAGDPMIGIIEIGNMMLTASGLLFAVGAFAGAMFLGTTAVPAGVATMLQLPVGALIGAGVTLSFVLPMLPFIIWIMAVTGYFLLVVEAVIAVNLWALSHLRMDGEGISGEAGRQGWLMMLTLFMTPSLMIFGYVVGMTIFRVTSSLIDVGLNQAATGILGSSIFVSMMAMVLYGIMICAVYFMIIERSFSLITELPDRVMKWMGAQVGINVDAGLAKKAIVGGAAGAGMIGASAVKNSYKLGQPAGQAAGNLLTNLKGPGKNDEGN